MTKIIVAQDAPVLVAIDIAKARHEVLIAIPDKKRRRRLTVLNELADFNRLVTVLKEYGRPVRVAFEATGNYHRALAYHLATAGFEVKLVSSVALARTREALNNSWDKNDPKDAQVILHLMEIGNEQYYHDPLVCGTNDIQELSKTHDIVSKSKTELWHRVLTHYLPLYFPEVDRFHRSSRSDWFFAFLERYPSPHFITAMGKDAFTADAWDVIGRKVAKERLLADIYETAKSSVGLPVAPDSDAIRMFRLVLGEGRSLIAQRNQIEDRAIALLKDLPDYQLLTSIPGIGPINALTILAEAGDLRRFGHHRQFLKFCGMDLATIQSGTFRGQTKLSKYGNVPACAAPYGWLVKLPFCSGPTASEISSSATSLRTATTHICAERRIPQSPPRWPAQFTGSLNMASPIAPSLRGDRSQKDLSL